MKIQIDFYSWLRNLTLSAILGFPFAYAAAPFAPFESGILVGFLACSWLIVLIFCLIKRNGVEIK